jgi:hypothetical protein
MGLLGSEHYANHPTVPIEKIKAMFNFDMIGRLAQDKLSIEGTPTASEFPELVRGAAERLGIHYESPGTDDSMFGRSDHASFYRKNIPVLFPFTGVHRQYHKPDDDWELIDIQGAARLLDMWYGLIANVANMETGPTFVEKKKPAEAGASSDAASADSSAAKPDQAAPRMPRVRLGITPSYSDSKTGLLVDSVIEGGAAQKGGMKDGDRILKIGKFEVKNIEGYMGVLSEFKAGDEVEVVVERAGQQVTLKITLSAPQRPRRE